MRGERTAMLNRLTVVLGAVLILALASPAQAQGYKWWLQDRYKTELSLSADQVTSLDEVYQSFRPQFSAGIEQLSRLEKQLSDLIADGTAAEPEVVKLIDQVESARSELGKARTLMMYRMHRILTPEQRDKLKALHDQDRKQNRRK